MNDEDRAFLDLFPTLKRSTVANLFLGPVRRGIAHPVHVYTSVIAELAERTDRAERYGYDTSTDALLATVRDNHDAGIAYARWCIAYEQLPPEEKKRRKQNSTAEGIGKWQEQQPATEKQIAYLARVGYTGPVHNRRHASSLIDIYMRGDRVEVGGAA